MKAEPSKRWCGFKRRLPEATVYVYDNNSSDGTGEIAARAGAVVRRERMQGKGASFAACFAKLTRTAI